MNGNLWLAVLLATVGSAAEPSVVARWGFDEESGEQATDSGPGTLHGTLRGNDGKLPERVAGRHGRALRFAPGTETWVELPANPAWDLRPPFTLAAWIRPEERGKTMEIFCHKGDPTPDGGHEGLRLLFYWRMLRFEFGDGQATHRVISEKDTLPEGYWSHVAAVHDGHAVRLYRNAELLLETATEAAPAPFRRAPVIGNYFGRKNAYPFIGAIDDLALLGAALDGEAIYRLAAGG